jgi:hypothetical protein
MMASTPDELFRAALRQYAKHHGGEYVATQYICVPHQLPPRVVDSQLNPPETEGELPDQYVTGDHDAHAVMPLIDGLTYVGHQFARVRSLARRYLRPILKPHWEEVVLCDMYRCDHMSDTDFRRIGEDLLWDGVWPEVDADRHLTGRIVESEEGYANVLNEAMMREDVAIAAGLVVEDGCVHINGGQ